MKPTYLLLLSAILVTGTAEAQKSPSRAVQADELTANFRDFQSKSTGLSGTRTMIDQCPREVRIGGTQAPPNQPSPLRIDSRVAVINSKIMVKCGL